MSWVEDSGMDIYEYNYVTYSSNLDKWTTKHGVTKEIHSLETSHIENIVKRIDSKKPVGRQEKKLDNLLKELRRRENGGLRIMTPQEFKESSYNKYVTSSKGIR